MKNILVAFLFCSISTIANAQAFQSSKTVLCDDTKKVIEALNSNWNEKPIWVAKDQKENTRYGLFVNSKTGSWTLLQFTSAVACILGVGEESTLISVDSI